MYFQDRDETNIHVYMYQKSLSIPYYSPLNDFFDILDVITIFFTLVHVSNS